jgi:hypothetical protein
LKTGTLYRDLTLRKLLAAHAVETQIKADLLVCSGNGRSLSFCITGEDPDAENTCPAILHLDQIIRDPEKVAAILLSKLQLNKTVFARKCEVRPVDKKTAGAFLEKYHLMNATKSAFNLGLWFEEELIALATFSKGRKMNRLPEDQRSFELIRFCCKSGMTVTGGLTKLLRHFCEEKQAGDIMTYVDKQLSDGRAFIQAGFKKHSETAPNYFLVNRLSFERTAADMEETFDRKKFYLSHNAGNIKLVYTPHEGI